MIDDTQTKDVLDHLMKYGSITQLEATTLYGATRLSAIVYNLRRWHGYVIDTVMETGTDRRGRKCRFGRYYLNMEKSAKPIK